MIYHVLIAVTAIIVLAVFWYAVQALVRRQTPDLPAGADVLACKSCSHERAKFCSYNPKDPRQAGLLPNPDGGCDYKE